MRVLRLTVLIGLSLPAQPARGPAVRGGTATVRADEILVVLPERIEVSLSKEGKVVKGVTRISVNGKNILAPRAAGAQPPLMSVIADGKIEPGPDWVAYLKERSDKKLSPRHPVRGKLGIEKIPLSGQFLKWGKEGDWVSVSLQLQKGSAEWLFAPAVEQIGGGTYKGVRWKLRLRGVGKIFEIAIEEPVAFREGDWRLSQPWDQWSEVHMSRSVPHKLPEWTWFSRQQPYFFLAGEGGSIVSYLGKVASLPVSEATEGEGIVLRSRVPVKAGTVVETPEKFWVLREGDFSSKWAAVNEWTWVYDSLSERYRVMKGIKAIEPMPHMFHQQQTTPALNFGLKNRREVKSTPPLEESWFYRLAKEVLPKAKEYGVRTMEIRGPWDSDADHQPAEGPEGASNIASVCAPWELKISEPMGGEKAFAYLCKTAHDMGIKILVWSTPAHLSNASPLLQQHPDWLVWDIDGQVLHFNYRDISGVSLRRGYFDYAVGRYAELRKATGLDGVWQDSFLTFGIATDFSEAAPYPQLDEVIELQRRLQELGYTHIQIEGAGPFGLSATCCERGPQQRSITKLKEYGSYYYLQHPDGVENEPRSHFRAVASKAMIEINSVAAFEKLPADVRQQIAWANNVYVQMLPLMKRRRLIGEGDRWKGVEWLDAAGNQRVLFAFEPMEWKVPKGSLILNVRDNREFVTDGGVVKAEPWQVYQCR